MFTKKFKNDKAGLEKFKVEFKNGELEATPIFNILHRAANDINSPAHDYAKYITFGRTNLSSLIPLAHWHDDEILTKHFGRFDFQFKGNRLYRNFVMEFKGLTFIVPDKISVVVDPSKTLDEIDSAVAEFSMLFDNFIFKNALDIDNYATDKTMNDLIESLRSEGYITNENEVDFDHVFKDQKSLINRIKGTLNI